MVLNEQSLIKGFREVGLKPGDSVLVHSSLSSFGYVEGGALAVINSLLKVVEDEGLIIVPTLTGKEEDSPKNPPKFDVRLTPCWTGKIPEIFRGLPQAKRSLHPTHSVAAIGNRRDDLINGHETGKSPCDKKSPYYKNAIWDGYVMLIGVDQESNTTIHCIEEIANVPYHLQSEETSMYITDYLNKKVLVRNRLHDWHKPPTNFNKLEPVFEHYNIIKKITIGKSIIRLIKAKDMLNIGVDKLSSEPLFLLV